MRIWQEQNFSTASTGRVGRVFPGLKMPFEDVTHSPALTIRNHVKNPVIEHDAPTPPMPEGQRQDKPSYRVPTMEEIRALPWNGLTAASTFSGCGGSSLGYRMAGFRVLFASEFVEAARDTYRANAAPYTVLDERDIRDVSGADLCAAAGVAVGELDLLDGSPPCASFSTAGSREKGWGKTKSYSDTEQRSDDLFFEFARLIREVQPRTFVAENVSGLVKGTAKGYFKLILRELRACGYRVEARLLDASWLGVPQARQRLIFIGVREDLGMGPVFPTPLPYQYTVRDALPWLEHPMVIRDGIGGSPAPVTLDNPAPTLMAHGIAGVSRTQAMLQGGPVYDEEGRALDPETGQRIGLEGYAIAEEWDKLRPGANSDRYFSLARPSEHAPAPTITASAGGISTAGITHPTERRKFTLGELRAIGGFPPDFVLTGTYAQRWERIGRAVPPVMMSHIAAAVRDGVLLPLRAERAA